MLGCPENPPRGKSADLTTDVQSYHEINPIYRDNLSDIKKEKSPIDLYLPTKTRCNGIYY